MTYMELSGGMKKKKVRIFTRKFEKLLLTHLRKYLQSGYKRVIIVKKTKYKDLQVKNITLASHVGGRGSSYIAYKTDPWDVIRSEGQRFWEDAYDSMVHAYELFCQNVRHTDPEMSDNVDEHLSRMWENLEEDDKTSNTGYAYFCWCNRDTTNPETNLSQMWKALSKAERKKWATSAELL